MKRVFIQIIVFSLSVLIVPTSIAPASDLKKNSEYDKTLKAAKQGDSDAQFKLGLMFSKGKSVAQDYAEAVKWYKKAAEQGLADAQCILGLIFAHGRGVAQDYDEALKWLNKAAEQGNAEAQFNLGIAFDNGKGVAQDYAEAAKWYKKAAEQGNADAQYSLGAMFAEGNGVAQDYAEAVKWYKKAAEQGYAKAQCNLGVMFVEGNGVAQDYAEAVKWYKKAAEQGHANAQFNLGLMFAKGKEVAENYIEAYKWFILSAAQGIETAVSARDILKQQMTPYQVTEAQRLAKEFVPKAENEKSDDIEQLKAKVKQLETTIETKQKTIRRAQKAVKKLRKQIAELKTENKRLVALYQKAKIEALRRTAEKKPKSPLVTGQWQVFETTTIDGWVKKVKRGTIFKTASGNIYEVVDVVILFEMELKPKVTVLTDGQFYKLLIKGVGEELLCKKLNLGYKGTISGDTVIEARITNDFDGLEYGNIYKLDNGQAWKQTGVYIYVYVSVMPKVIIWRDGSVHKMKVQGIDEAVTVQQLK